MAKTYQLVAASQSAKALGDSGAKGDRLDVLNIIVDTAATAEVTLHDGAESFVIFNASPGGGVNTYPIPVFAASQQGAWKVTTGAGVRVLATGNFS